MLAAGDIMICCLVTCYVHYGVHVAHTTSVCVVGTACCTAAAGPARGPNTLISDAPCLVGSSKQLTVLSTAALTSDCSAAAAAPGTSDKEARAGQLATASARVHHTLIWPRAPYGALSIWPRATSVES